DGLEVGRECVHLLRANILARDQEMLVKSHERPFPGPAEPVGGEALHPVMDREEAGPSGMQRWVKPPSRDREATMEPGRIAGAAGDRKRCGLSYKQGEFEKDHTRQPPGGR
ncbi:MAG TPA: hypothetical protein VGF62_05880, partial [Rhizomicrobium sp.]